ncbi:hypothetical protein EVAR_78361_1 [Eumeta japonica]|uniref:Uncharacterized protein n=1 Tax=Eumeta variegata TaxID=151549 RepID=A0A4C1T5Z7_EUMVA|nr:hypothetical protein EVAR_78361_1 [Eumeta japonica]
MPMRLPRAVRTQVRYYNIAISVSEPFANTGCHWTFTVDPTFADGTRGGVRRTVSFVSELRRFPKQSKLVATAPAPLGKWEICQNTRSRAPRPASRAARAAAMHVTVGFYHTTEETLYLRVKQAGEPSECRLSPPPMNTRNPSTHQFVASLLGGNSISKGEGIRVIDEKETNEPPELSPTRRNITAEFATPHP